MLAQGNVLLVVDDIKESEAIKRYLISMNAVVYKCTDSESAKKALAERDYLCCIIHLKNNPVKGLEICSWIRSESVVPIIMITSRNESVDEHMALRAGANDYMLSPVEQRILVARVHQQVNRIKRHEIEVSNVHEYQGLIIDCDSHLVTYNGVEIQFTNTEFQIVKLLSQNPKRVFTRDEILCACGTLEGMGSNHLIDTHISRVRKRIIEAGGPSLIFAVRGVGYRLAQFKSLQKEGV